MQDLWHYSLKMGQVLIRIYLITWNKIWLGLILLDLKTILWNKDLINRATKSNCQHWRLSLWFMVLVMFVCENANSHRLQLLSLESGFSASLCFLSLYTEHVWIFHSSLQEILTGTFHNIQIYPNPNSESRK